MSGSAAGPEDFGSSVVPLRANFGGGSSSGLGGGSSGGGLESRVARLEADIGHMQRDLNELRSDMKTALATLTRLDERLSHLATREWVMWRFFSASVLLVAVAVALAGYAPRLQAIFGTAPLTPT